MAASRLRELADLYVQTVQERDFDGLAALFARDCEYLNGAADGTLHSREEIDALYRRLLGPQQARHDVRIAAFVEQGDECAFELEVAPAGSGDWRLAALDRLTLGVDGTISRFAAFFFGPTPAER